MKGLFDSRKLQSGELIEKIKATFSGNVSGFYRLSNDEEPVMLSAQLLPEFSADAVPFLFEAAFFDGKVSVSVRQYNDYWLVNTVEWNETPPGAPGSGDDYLVYRQFDKTRKSLLFYTQYLPVVKNGFEVLMPAWNAFIGFEEKEN
ncbi:MAG: hypothetical protein J6Y92_09865 [Lentisphaeria bacterium]|nr:hypothetical protein [Lentisphaeria bacterium]